MSSGRKTKRVKIKPKKLSQVAQNKINKEIKSIRVSSIIEMLSNYKASHDEILRQKAITQSRFKLDERTNFSSASGCVYFFPPSYEDVIIQLSNLEKIQDKICL